MMIRSLVTIFLGSAVALPWGLRLPPAQNIGIRLMDEWNRSGVRYYERDDYRRAARTFDRALETRKFFHVPEDLFAAQIFHNAATAHFYLKERSKSESDFIEAARIREKFLGSAHPDLAQTLSNQAILYLFDHEYDKARPLFERALEIRKNVLGPEHLETARTLHDLAELYRGKGALGKALALHDRALRIRLKSDPYSEFTGASFYDLGEIFRSQHHLKKARAAYRRAFGVFYTGLGAGHHFTRAAQDRLYEVTGGAEGAPCKCQEGAKAPGGV